MSTIQAVRSNPALRPFGFRRIVDRYFYLFTSLLIAAIVLIGFRRTVNQRLLHPLVKPPALLWVHGIVFLTWIALFILQSALVRVHKVKLHRLLGWFFAGLGALVPVLGVAIARVMARFQIKDLHAEPIERLAHLAIPLQDMVAFTAAFGLAILWRKRPEYHRRLMLIATSALTAAAWGRLLTVQLPFIGFYCGVDGLIMLGVLRDLFISRRVHPVYIYFIPPLILLQLGAIAIHLRQPETWVLLGRAFLGN